MKTIITMHSLIRLCKKNNWILKSYSQSMKLIEKYQFGNYCSNHKAFTFSYGEKYYILYRDNLPYNEKLRLICHEIGHITLKHTSIDGILNCFGNEETEADEFANNMLMANKVYGIITAVAVSIALLTCLLLNGINPKGTDDSPLTEAYDITTIAKNIHNEKMVYITPSGSRYHRSDCYIIQNSNIIEVSIEQVQESYTPCKICRPNEN